MARTFPRPDFSDELVSVPKWLYHQRRRYTPEVRKERDVVRQELEAQRVYVEQILPTQEEKRWSA